MAKRITNIKVISAGSSPDIDSDFHTEHRERAIEYVSDLYGKDNVANIITFNRMAAKGALKSLCTIYEIPFKEANRIAQLLPGPVDGKEMTLGEVFDPRSARYEDAYEFRDAVSSSEWDQIIKGALAVEGKNSSLGVHACGIIISSKPLPDVVPLHVRQDDQRVITQWTYQECEEIGLIKMDMLGLDTVDLIQSTVKNIIDSGKEPPVLSELIHGALDDSSVYEMFAKGETIGIFQFGSDMVRDLLIRMKPTEFNDLVACTAVARPGPMGMKSHEKYADRKNGIEKIDFIHKEFDNSPLTEILDETYGLVLYQESVTKIANIISGMTLQEGDDLRKAMGKKKADVMMKLKPKFISGGMKNGFSEEAMTVLWETLEPFSLYAFNKSHSVAYALTAYQSAYLKKYYPAEFMSALITQNIHDRDKTLSFLAEAKRMGLNVSPPNINKSGIIISPDKTDSSGKNIAFGLGGIKGVGSIAANIVVKEREENGEYTNLKDLVKRTSLLSVNKTALVSLVNSGACDSFHHNRKAMEEYTIKEILTTRKNKTKGNSLFEIFDLDDDLEKFDDIEELFSERVKKEADLVGFYLGSHPLDNIHNSNLTTLSNAKKSTRGTFYIYATCVSLDVKTGRGKTTYKIGIEDKTDSLIAYAPKNVISRWDKYKSQQQLLKAIETNDNSIKEEIIMKALNTSVWAQEPIMQHTVYLFKINVSNYGVRIVDIYPAHLSRNGSLASQLVTNVSVNLTKRQDEIDDYKEKLLKIESKYPGDNLLTVSFVPELKSKDNWGSIVSTPISIYDEKIIRNTHRAGIITKEKSRELLKMIYFNNHYKNANYDKMTRAELKNIHSFYPISDFSVYVNANDEKLPYDLETLVGDGNYHLR